MREDYFREYCRMVKEERKKEKDAKDKGLYLHSTYFINTGFKPTQNENQVFFLSLLVFSWMGP